MNTMDTLHVIERLNIATIVLFPPRYFSPVQILCKCDLIFKYKKVKMFARNLFFLSSVLLLRARTKRITFKRRICMCVDFNFRSNATHDVLLLNLKRFVKLLWNCRKAELTLPALLIIHLMLYMSFYLAMLAM